jgi:hypothetical protein
MAQDMLIDLAFRKKRRQADSCDAPLTSTPTTTISTPAGRAFPLPSKSSVQCLLHAAIFPDSETVHHTSVRMRFMLTPVARHCIGQLSPNRRAPVANSALGEQRDDKRTAP